MFAFTRKPAWLVLHAVVLAIVVVFIMLGRWQLERLEERRASNAIVSARLAAPTIAWTPEMETPGEYTRLTVRGEFSPDDEMLLRSQVSLGRPGFDILTPLYPQSDAVVETGFLGDPTGAVERGILVNRGWVPLEYDKPPVTEASPPAGEVTIEGFVRYPLETGGATVPSNGERTRIVARVDPDDFAGELERPLMPFYIELTSIEPSGGQLPIPADPPDLTEGSHFSYAFQWFSFAVVAVVGYAALIRSTARRRSGARRRAAPPPLHRS